MKNAIGGLGVLVLAVGLLSHSVPSQEVGRVVRVVDADTYDILTGGTTYRVRLLGVDAPEPDQAFGHQATDSVTRLLGPQRRILLTRRGVDLYGRTLATVRLPMGEGPALTLDSLLVVRGWAWAWDPKRRVAGRAPQQAAAVAGKRCPIGVSYGSAGQWACSRRTSGGDSITKTSGVTGWAAPGSKAAECKQPNENKLFTPNNDPLLWHVKQVF